MSSTILIADDETEIIDLLKRRLTKLGYIILTATTGTETYQKAQKYIPSLIILDVMLPELNGFEICRLLKFDPKYEHIKVILFSGRNQHADKEIGRQVRADAYLTKPFDTETLLSKVKELLKES